MLEHLLEATLVLIGLLSIVLVVAAVRMSGAGSQQELQQDRYQMMTDYIEETGDDENPSGR